MRETFAETDSLARTEPAFHTNEKARLLSTLTTNLDYVIFAGLAIGAFALAHWLMRRRQVKMRPVVWVLVAAFLGMGAWLVDDAGQRERTRIVAMITIST